jgi:hypothetical protein
MSKDTTHLSFVESVERDSNYQQKCKDHPIESKLLHHTAEQFDAFSAIMFSCSTGNLSSQSFISALINCWPHIIFTLSWIFGDIENSKSAPPSLQELLSAGWTDQMAMEYIGQFGNRRRGRPVTTRQLAVKALEMRASNPKLSWAKLAIKFSTPQQSYSKDAIRREAIRLKKFLESID